VRRSFPRANAAGGKDIGSRRRLCNQSDNDGGQRDLKIENEEEFCRNKKDRGSMEDFSTAESDVEMYAYVSTVESPPIQRANRNPRPPDPLAFWRRYSA
jgi:hypothetical protein